MPSPKGKYYHRLMLPWLQVAMTTVMPDFLLLDLQHHHFLKMPHPEGFSPTNASLLTKDTEKNETWQRHKESRGGGQKFTGGLLPEMHN